MQSWSRFLMRFVVAVAIVLISFFAALTVFNYFDIPKLTDQSDDSNRIRIVEATYAMNCKDYNVKPPNQNRVALGNATAVVTRACEKKSRECKFKIEVGELGDPAYGCDKGFSVGWRCGNVEEIHEAHAAAPADDKSVLLSCP